jgi:hypothetical protein
MTTEKRSEGERCGQCGREIDHEGCCGYELTECLRNAKDDLEKIQGKVEALVDDIKKDLKGTDLKKKLTKDQIGHGWCLTCEAHLGASRRRIWGKNFCPRCGDRIQEAYDAATTPPEIKEVR